MESVQWDGLPFSCIAFVQKDRSMIRTTRSLPPLFSIITLQTASAVMVSIFCAILEQHCSKSTKRVSLVLFMD